MHENTDWNIVYQDLDTESAYNNFFQHLDHCFEVSFPKKKVIISKRNIPLNP